MSREAEAKIHTENVAHGVAVLFDELSEVTPAMLGAGNRAIFGMVEIPHEYLTAIWRAMLAAKLGGIHERQ